jgi:hypothetical protein
MSENCGGLIIDPQELARIRAACQLRAAELERAEALQCPAKALEGLPWRGTESTKVLALPAIPATATEAERFAVAVQQMPARVRAFFEREDSPYVPAHRRESIEDRKQRQQRESVGGWCG